MKQQYNMQNNIIIQYKKIENNIVTYKEYCNTKKQLYNVQNNMIVLRTNITRHKNNLTI